MSLYLPCNTSEIALSTYCVSRSWHYKISSLVRCCSVLACYSQAVGLCSLKVLVEVCDLRLEVLVQLYISQADDRW